jgi:signal transduction histidine kinase/ActR/RegA family two-component response regulator
MALTSEKIAQGLIYTAVGRRAQAPMRLFVAILLAVSFRGQFENQWLWAWLTAYVATQLFEFWALLPFRSERPTPPTWRSWTAVASIFLLAAAFGAIAIPLWLVPGSLGPAGAVLLLAGSILNVLSLSRGSPLAFMAGAIPYGAYLMSAPLIDRALRGSDPFSLPFILAEVLFLVAAVLVFNAAERLAAAQVKATEELEARRAGAEAAAEAKSAFVATVSHELRTPLAGILAAAGDLQRRAIEPELRGRAAMVIQGGRMMHAILDDLLDLSKLEAGRMRVENAPFNPRLMIEDAAQFWSSEAERKGLSLTLDGAERLPAWVEGDPLRLRQILNNLLSNAVKFTDAGGVRIEVEARDNGGRIVFSVAVVDTGVGLTPDRLALLFEPFEQGDVAIARTHGGTGLGLAISRQLARLMGGDLVADGTPGRGSRFSFTVVLGRACAPEAANAPDAPPPGAAAPRILVIDDHEIGRRALSLLLEPLGAVVAQAAGAEAALAMLAMETFDLVLSDVTMEGVDGLEFCRRLRAAPGPNRATSVLAVTGRTEARDVEACLAAGMTGWVAKPIEPRQLYQAIEAALSGAEAVEEAAA